MKEGTSDQDTRSDLYPEIEAYATGRLSVGAPHVLYWEQSGNPNGRPILFLHGGPGAGATPGHRRFFDPDHYRVVIFDQRGAGRSTPLGELTDNTTAHLIDDIEMLRQTLDIDGWSVFGGSWGSSLALAYAQAHPSRVTSLILRGVFLCRSDEVDWFLHGMGRFFPEAAASFRSHLPADERGALLDNYYRRLTDPNPAVHMPAAAAWSRYEAECSTLMPSPDTVSALTEPSVALGLARIEAHYFANDLFLEEGQLLDRADRLAGIPGIVVQGRYDVVCPPTSAFELGRAWPQGELIMVPDAGHSATEASISSALVRATERFKTH